MIRRLFLLNGFAIIAVVISHTAFNRGFIELFSWLALKPIDPNAYYDGSGTFLYFVLISLTKLTLFSVPTFLIISGFFITYASKGSKKVSKWKVVQTRLVTLLIPYVIWSCVIFFSDFLKNGGEILPVTQYLLELFLGLADPTYWYIPLLVQFYILSPILLIPLEKNYWQLLLFISALIHISTSTIAYMEYFVEIPIILQRISQHGLLFREILYFVLGMVIASQMRNFKIWITRYRHILLAITVIAGFLAIIEGHYLFQLTQFTIGFRETPFTTIYILAFIFAFLAYDRKIPGEKKIRDISNSSYGIYLLHNQVQGAFSKLIYRLAPSLLNLQIIYLPVLFMVGLLIPFYFMELIAKSRLRWIYRYLFG